MRVRTILPLLLALIASGCLLTAESDDDDDDGATSATPTPTPTNTPPTNLVVFTMPVEGREVYVHAATGAIVETVLTDDTGTAEIDLPVDGMITIADDYGTGVFLTTFVSPPPGTIRIANGDPDAATTPVPTPTPLPSTLDVTFTNVPAEAQTTWWVHHCSQQFYLVPAATVNDSESAYDCGKPSWGVLAMALDSADRPVRWGQTTGASLNAGGTVPITVDLSNTDFESTEFTYGPLPADAEVELHLEAFTESGFYARSRPTFDGVLAGETRTLALPNDVAGDRYIGFRADERHDLSGQDTRTYFWYAVLSTALAASYSFDPQDLPALAVLPLDVTDPAHPILEWTDATYGDIVSPYFRWETDDGFGATQSIWSFVSASGSTSLRVPDLPGSLASFGPKSGSIFFGRGVSAFDFSGVDGLAEYLSHDPYAFSGDPSTGVRHDIWE